MGNLIDKLERKIGRYAIPRLPLYMIICYGAGYIMQIINPNVAYSISLNPDAILHGQVWRLFSWVLIPPRESNVFFLLIMLYFYYSIGMTLERMWGAFHFNFYIFSGMLYTVIASFLIYGYFAVFMPGVLVTDAPALVGYNGLFAGISTEFFSTYYINMSIFLAFAAMFPNVQVLLFFVLPIKVKVLGIFYVVIMVYEALGYYLTYGNGGLLFTIIQLVVIFASLLNFIVFFASTKKTIGLKRQARTAEQRKAAEEYRRKVNAMRPASKVSKHKCVVCERTSDTNPELEFRFCSKCEGNYEYCQDHLFRHSHVKAYQNDEDK